MTREKCDDSSQQIIHKTAKSIGTHHLKKINLVYIRCYLSLYILPNRIVPISEYVRISEVIH